MKIRNNDLSYKSIDIDIADGVSIHLYKCEYDELIKLLLPDMEQEIKMPILSIRGLWNNVSNAGRW